MLRNATAAVAAAAVAVLLAGCGASVTPVPAAVQRRSTWTAGCPVTVAELRYVTVGFRGFDGKAHTGELIVHRDVAADV
ncbi:MAG TPA: hypothetical protein VLM05_12370, partial [Mycobacteriales bacterium]|nr:hypothetical protein [Mycobacteriales bacterium]